MSTSSTEEQLVRAERAWQHGDLAQVRQILADMEEAAPTPAQATRIEQLREDVAPDVFGVMLAATCGVALLVLGVVVFAMG